jgi:hypothetical protein
MVTTTALGLGHYEHYQELAIHDRFTSQTQPKMILPLSVRRQQVGLGDKLNGEQMMR